jgi:hypothetical protein
VVFVRLNPRLHRGLLSAAPPALNAVIAKRQLTQFRRQLDPEWIELKPDESLEKCVEKIYFDLAAREK